MTQKRKTKSSAREEGHKAVKRNPAKKKSVARKADESANVENCVGEMLMNLFVDLPNSNLTPSGNPDEQAKNIAIACASKLATTSFALAIPPGPLGLLTILPDLKNVYKKQSQMVADIAAVYGKQARMNESAMLYCLFKHATSHLLRDLVVRVGTQYVTKRTTRRILQQLLQKVGVQVTQRILGRSLSRTLPVIGAFGIGAYAFYDTSKVAQTAIQFFSKEINESEDLFLIQDNQEGGKK